MADEGTPLSGMAAKAKVVSGKTILGGGPFLMKKAPMMMKKVMMPKGKLPFGAKLPLKGKGPLTKVKSMPPAPRQALGFPGEFTDTTQVIPPASIAQNGSDRTQGHKAFSRIPSLPPPVPSRDAGENSPPMSEQTSSPDRGSTYRSMTTDSSPPIAVSHFVNAGQLMQAGELRTTPTQIDRHSSLFTDPASIQPNKGSTLSVQVLVDSPSTTHFPTMYATSSSLQERPALLIPEGDHEERSNSSVWAQSSDGESVSYADGSPLTNLLLKTEQHSEQRFPHMDTHSESKVEVTMNSISEQATTPNPSLTMELRQNDDSPRETGMREKANFNDPEPSDTLLSSPSLETGNFDVETTETQHSINSSESSRIAQGVIEAGSPSVTENKAKASAGDQNETTEKAQERSAAHPGDLNAEVKVEKDVRKQDAVDFKPGSDFSTPIRNNAFDVGQEMFENERMQTTKDDLLAVPYVSHDDVGKFSDDEHSIGSPRSWTDEQLSKSQISNCVLVKGDTDLEDDDMTHKVMVPLLITSGLPIASAEEKMLSEGTRSFAGISEEDICSGDSRSQNRSRGSDSQILTDEVILQENEVSGLVSIRGQTVNHNRDHASLSEIIRNEILVSESAVPQDRSSQTTSQESLYPSPSTRGSRTAHHPTKVSSSMVEWQETSNVLNSNKSLGKAVSLTITPIADFQNSIPRTPKRDVSQSSLQYTGERWQGGEEEVFVNEQSHELGSALFDHLVDGDSEQRYVKEENDTEDYSVSSSNESESSRPPQGQGMPVQMFDLSSSIGPGDNSLNEYFLNHANAMPAPQVAVVAGFVNDDLTEPFSDRHSIFAGGPDFASSYRARLSDTPPQSATPDLPDHEEFTSDQEEESATSQRAESLITGETSMDVKGSRTVRTNLEADMREESVAPIDTDFGLDSPNSSSEDSQQSMEGLDVEAILPQDESMDVSIRLRKLVQDTHALMSDHVAQEGLTGVQILDAIQQGDPGFSPRDGSDLSPSQEARASRSHRKIGSFSHGAADSGLVSEAENCIAVVVGFASTSPRGPTPAALFSSDPEDCPGVAHPHVQSLVTGGIKCPLTRSVSHDIAQVDGLAPAMFNGEQYAKRHIHVSVNSKQQSYVPEQKQLPPISTGTFRGSVASQGGEGLEHESAKEYQAHLRALANLGMPSTGYQQMPLLTQTILPMSSEILDSTSIHTLSQKPVLNAPHPLLQEACWEAAAETSSLLKQQPEYELLPPSPIAASKLPMRFVEQVLPTSLEVTTHRANRSISFGSQQQASFRAQLPLSDTTHPKPPLQFDSARPSLGRKVSYSPATVHTASVALSTQREPSSIVPTIHDEYIQPTGLRHSVDMCEPRLIVDLESIGNSLEAMRVDKLSESHNGSLALREVPVKRSFGGGSLKHNSSIPTLKVSEPLAFNASRVASVNRTHSNQFLKQAFVSTPQSAVSIETVTRPATARSLPSAHKLRYGVIRHATDNLQYVSASSLGFPFGQRLSQAEKLPSSRPQSYSLSASRPSPMMANSKLDLNHSEVPPPALNATSPRLSGHWTAAATSLLGSAQQPTTAIKARHSRHHRKRSKVSRHGTQIASGDLLATKRDTIRSHTKKQESSMTNRKKESSTCQCRC